MKGKERKEKKRKRKRKGKEKERKGGCNGLETEHRWKKTENQERYMEWRGLGAEGRQANTSWNKLTVVHNYKRDWRTTQTADGILRLPHYATCSEVGEKHVLQMHSISQRHLLCEASHSF